MARRRHSLISAFCIFGMLFNNASKTLAILTEQDQEQIDNLEDARHELKDYKQSFCKELLNHIRNTKDSLEIRTYCLSIAIKLMDEEQLYEVFKGVSKDTLNQLLNFYKIDNAPWVVYRSIFRLNEGIINPDIKKFLKWIVNTGCSYLYSNNFNQRFQNRNNVHKLGILKIGDSIIRSVCLNDIIDEKKILEKIQQIKLENLGSNASAETIFTLANFTCDLEEQAKLFCVALEVDKNNFCGLAPMYGINILKKICKANPEIMVNALNNNLITANKWIEDPAHPAIRATENMDRICSCNKFQREVNNALRCLLSVPGLNNTPVGRHFLLKSIANESKKIEFDNQCFDVAKDADVRKKAIDGILQGLSFDEAVKTHGSLEALIEKLLLPYTSKNEGLLAATAIMKSDVFINESKSFKDRIYKKIRGFCHRFPEVSPILYSAMLGNKNINLDCKWESRTITRLLERTKEFESELKRAKELLVDWENLNSYILNAEDVHSLYVYACSDECSSGQHAEIFKMIANRKDFSDIMESPKGVRLLLRVASDSALENCERKRIIYTVIGNSAFLNELRREIEQVWCILDDINKSANIEDWVTDIDALKQNWTDIMEVPEGMELLLNIARKNPDERILLEIIDKDKSYVDFMHKGPIETWELRRELFLILARHAKDPGTRMEAVYALKGSKPFLQFISSITGRELLKTIIDCSFDPKEREIAVRAMIKGNSYAEFFKTSDPDKWPYWEELLKITDSSGIILTRIYNRFSELARTSDGVRTLIKLARKPSISPSMLKGIIFAILSDPSSLWDKNKDDLKNSMVAVIDKVLINQSIDFWIDVIKSLEGTDNQSKEPVQKFLKFKNSDVRKKMFLSIARCYPYKCVLDAIKGTNAIYSKLFRVEMTYSKFLSADDFNKTLTLTFLRGNDKELKSISGDLLINIIGNKESFKNLNNTEFGKKLLHMLAQFNGRLNSKSQAVLEQMVGDDYEKLSLTSDGQGILFLLASNTDNSEVCKKIVKVLLKRGVPLKQIINSKELRSAYAQTLCDGIITQEAKENEFSRLKKERLSNDYTTDDAKFNNELIRVLMTSMTSDLSGIQRIIDTAKDPESDAELKQLAILSLLDDSSILWDQNINQGTLGVDVEKEIKSILKDQNDGEFCKSIIEFLHGSNFSKFKGSDLRKSIFLSIAEDYPYKYVLKAMKGRGIKYTEFFKENEFNKELTFVFLQGGKTGKIDEELKSISGDLLINIIGNKESFENLNNTEYGKKQLHMLAQFNGKLESQSQTVLEQMVGGDYEKLSLTSDGQGILFLLASNTDNSEVCKKIVHVLLRRGVPLKQIINYKKLCSAYAQTFCDAIITQEAKENEFSRLKEERSSNNYTTDDAKFNNEFIRALMTSMTSDLSGAQMIIDTAKDPETDAELKQLAILSLLDDSSVLWDKNSSQGTLGVDIKGEIKSILKDQNDVDFYKSIIKSLHDSNFSKFKGSDLRKSILLSIAENYPYKYVLEAIKGSDVKYTTFFKENEFNKELTFVFLKGGKDGKIDDDMINCRGELITQIRMGQKFEEFLQTEVGQKMLPMLAKYDSHISIREKASLLIIGKKPFEQFVKTPDGKEILKSLARATKNDEIKNRAIGALAVEGMTVQEFTKLHLLRDYGNWYWSKNTKEQNYNITLDLIGNWDASGCAKNEIVFYGMLIKKTVNDVCKNRPEQKQAIIEKINSSTSFRENSAEFSEKLLSLLKEV